MTVEAPAWRTAVTDPESLCRRAAVAALASAPGAPAEVSVLLTDDARIARLNGRYRGQDRPTNVLSFPAGGGPAGTGGPRLLGDVVVALETTRREAADAGRAVAEHLAHLVVHGTLHLLGYDHVADREAERMEAREVELLAGLGIADPYRGAAARQ